MTAVPGPQVSSAFSKFTSERGIQAAHLLIPFRSRKRGFLLDCRKVVQ
jgi:hypothetical protein